MPSVEVCDRTFLTLNTNMSQSVLGMQVVLLDRVENLTRSQVEAGHNNIEALTRDVSC
ncbi:hypothetical protein H6S82_03170 [Planktothrix sp. FACHB-1355]|uniref:Uncharacterized protein n=1 Tax=Aerosakkonema funiforme FACHB-1375 TaxID=2949571 RepID=A0A926ZIE2_9CYAN|nr:MULTISPECIES: hypothetical protein [Oscillatoriales]MBD2183995.1 hypothetical protein [Aerosakkonema funiforme FACHB-1375]MBD3557858.1 hypothetical protein [Planktothrix sp. FACHB-1355]